jgi:polyketide cyclase/dehydrase/lipid transport protein
MAIGEVEKAIDVELPLRTVYNEWTMFEEFPRFMEGVERVEQLSPERVHWTARIGGQRREWDARIIEQLPDRRIVWKAERGEPNSGAVAFKQVDGRTRVGLHIEYDPEGVAENAADALGLVSRRVEGDLRRFKEYLEDLGHEAGGWRGTRRPTPGERAEARRMAAKAERAIGAQSGSWKRRVLLVIGIIAVSGGLVAAARKARHDRAHAKRRSIRHLLGFE